MYVKAFFIKEKWEILFFALLFIAGFISSFIFIGGPVTYSAPFGVLCGFLLLLFIEYRRFKKTFTTQS